MGGFRRPAFGRCRQYVCKKRDVAPLKKHGTASSSSKSIATFGCPRDARELVRLIDLQWHRRPTYRDTDVPSHVAIRNRGGGGGAGGAILALRISLDFESIVNSFEQHARSID